MFNAALSRIAAPATIAITQRGRDLSAAGRDIVSLSAGQPDFDTPEHIKQAAVAALARGETKYPPVAGIARLREAVAAKFARENGLGYRPEQVIVGTGGKQIVSGALMATLNPGDEVIIPVPSWVSYPQLTELFGGTPVIVATSAATNFKLIPAQLEAAISPRTRWLVINSPSNPTGSVYTAADWRGLADVLLRHPQVSILTDDIYEHLVYDAAFTTPAQVEPALIDRTLTMNGFSKAYAMTGWRLGYGAGPLPLIAMMEKLQSQLTSGACVMAQHAGVAALEGPQDFIRDSVRIYRRRRDLVLDRLSAIPGLRCATPQGAFYVFADCRALLDGRTDAAFAEALLDEVGLAAVPGSAFGAPGYLRLSFAAADTVLEEGCRRLARFCGALVPMEAT